MAEAISVAFIVPALNEEGNLEATVEDIGRALAGLPIAAHVLIFDDGSTDKTGEIADRLAAADPRVRAIHNPARMGLGYNYFRGVELAEDDFVVMVPGDHEIPAPGIRQMLEVAGRTELIIPYMEPSDRPWPRRLISMLFVRGLNVLFGLRLRYYNGPCVLPRRLVLATGLRSSGFAYMAAIVAVLVRSGHSYREIHIPLAYRKSGRSKAFHWKNVLSVFETVARTTYLIRVRRLRV